MAEQVNPHGELMNCLQCGRDTRAKNGICARCLGGERSSLKGEEQKGRKARSASVLGGTAIRDTEPADDVEQTDRQYHGGSPRDDI